MQLILLTAYAVAVASGIFIAAILFANDAWTGAVFLWVASIIVIALHWIVTGRFWPEGKP